MPMSNADKAGLPPTEPRRDPTIKSTKPIIKDLGREEQPCVIAIEVFQGKMYLNSRYWYHPTPGSEELRPGKNGINVPINFGWEYIQTLIEAMNQSHNTDMGLVDLGTGKAD